MNRYEKKRILEQDLDTLIEDFLQVREKQLTASDEECLELERQATTLLSTINQKQQDIISLFPDEPSPFLANLRPNPYGEGMDIFKKRDLLEKQIELLPDHAPQELRESLEEDLRHVGQLVQSVYRAPSASQPYGRSVIGQFLPK